MYELLFDPRVIWFVFGLVLLVGELLTPGIVLVFFGLGAWTVALFLAVLPLGTGLQCAAFLAMSALYLVLFRSKLSTLFYGKTLQLKNYATTLHDDIIGREVDVIESILPHHPGRVLLNGTLWQATATTAIPAGCRVRIIKQDVLVFTVEIVS